MTEQPAEQPALPESGISFDLDAYERPKPAKAPFKVNIKGRAITMLDPNDLDWQDLLSIETPEGFLAYAISEDDKDYLREQKIPGWKFAGLMESYMDHYDLEKDIAAAKQKKNYRI